MTKHFGKENVTMVALYPEFYNDVFGPIMQPGSSSHMAGPCRAGNLAAMLLGEEVAHICIELDSVGSLAGTLGTMNEDVGMLNGAWGREVSHPDFFTVYADLKAAGVTQEIRVCEMKESTHANAMKFILTGKSGRRVSLVADSIGGGMVETVSVNGYAFAGRGDSYVLCAFAPADPATLAEYVCAAQDVLETGVGKNAAGELMVWFKLTETPNEAVVAALGETDYAVMAPIVPVMTTRDKKPQLFKSIAEWAAIAKETGKSMSEVAIDYEIAASGWSREDVVAYMRDTVMATMNRRVFAVANGEVEPPAAKLSRMTYANWGSKMGASQLIPALMAKSLYYTFSARTVCPGVLNVPGPQGNGGGFISAVLNSVKEELNLTDEDMLRGLFVAAGVGAICYTRTKPTGEEIGCAGECGCCMAMASAAVVEMMGGTPEQIDAAASMAMQLAIGWPCDVIPGGNGAPCTSRIMSVAVMSIVFAQWAMIDENPVIPFHEALDAAAALGENMHPDLLCTGRGGMCATPTGRACAAALQASRQKKD